MRFSLVAVFDEGADAVLGYDGYGEDEAVQWALPWSPSQGAPSASASVDVGVGALECDWYATLFCASARLHSRVLIQATPL